LIAKRLSAPLTGKCDLEPPEHVSQDAHRLAVQDHIALQARVSRVPGAVTGDPALGGVPVAAETHPHLCAAVLGAAELSLAGQRADQGEAETHVLSRSRDALDARALVGDHDIDLIDAPVDVDRHRARLPAVGVQDDVVAGLADGGLKIRSQLGTEVDSLREATEGGPYDGYVLWSVLELEANTAWLLDNPWAQLNTPCLALLAGFLICPAS
jgi:hypothetical protein